MVSVGSTSSHDIHGSRECYKRCQKTVLHCTTLYRVAEKSNRADGSQLSHAFLLRIRLGEGFHDLDHFDGGYGGGTGSIPEVLVLVIRRDLVSGLFDYFALGGILDGLAACITPKLIWIRWDGAAGLNLIVESKSSTLAEPKSQCAHPSVRVFAATIQVPYYVCIGPANSAYHAR